LPGWKNFTHPRRTTEDLEEGPPLEGRPPAPTLVAELGVGIARLEE